MKLKRARDQVVVVLGAATGIGRLTALELGRRGARVVASARDVDAIEALAAEIRAAGGQAMAVPADAALPEQVQTVADAAERTFGGIDTWINMAAVSTYAPFSELTPDEWRRIMTIDLLGYVHGAQAALPALRRRGGGALINVSSIEGRVAMPLHSAYAAAKHAIIGMTDALRIELRHDRVPVSVTNIMPAAVDTPFFDHAGTKMGVKPKPIPPVYPPEKVVGAILYAAEHPVRDLVVGGGGRLLIAGRLLFPALTDLLIARSAYRLQRSRQPRRPEEPSGLDTAVGDRRIRGSEGTAPRPIRSPGLVALHPAAAFLGALALVTAGVFTTRALLARS